MNSLPKENTKSTADYKGFTTDPKSKDDPDQVLKKQDNAYFRNYYRKKHPRLPIAPSGKRYNPKFKWNALALSMTGPVFFKDRAAACGLLKAIYKLGFKAKTKSTNQGYKVTRIEVKHD